MHAIRKSIFNFSGYSIFYLKPKMFRYKSLYTLSTEEQNTRFYRRRTHVILLCVMTLQDYILSWVC